MPMPTLLIRWTGRDERLSAGSSQKRMHLIPVSSSLRVKQSVMRMS